MSVRKWSWLRLGALAWFLCSLVVLVSACAQHGGTRNTDAVFAEEARVYGVIIDTLAQRAVAQRVVISASSSMVLPRDRKSPPWQRVASLPGIQESTTSDLEARNTRPQRVGPFVETRVPVILLEAPESNEFPRQDAEEFWRAFYERYPASSGIITVSRPGLSADGRQAVVIVEHRCGTRCNTGYAMLLTRESGVWRLMAERVLWIS
jgi:hypothetical protein